MTRPRVVTTAALLIVPFFLTGCGLKAKNPTATSTQTPLAEVTPNLTTGTPLPSSTGTAIGTYLTIDASSLSANITDHLNQANAKATAWHSDAQLVHYSIKFPTNFQIGQSVETFTYGSPADAYNWWTVTISGKTNKIVRALIPKDDFLGTGLASIPTQYWKMNYVEALQLAEVNGGSQFRARHTDAQVTAILTVTQPKNYLWWTIEYDADGIDPLKILVNPVTKEVDDSTGKPLNNVTASSPVAAPSPTSTVSQNKSVTGPRFQTPNPVTTPTSQSTPDQLQE